jgi:hypothetical protein
MYRGRGKEQSMTIDRVDTAFLDGFIQPEPGKKDSISESVIR